MSGILAQIGKVAAGLVVKKVTTVEPDACGGSEEVTRTRPREGVKGIGWIVGFYVGWHYIAYPILSYHCPQYHWPPLDAGKIVTILLGLM